MSNVKVAAAETESATVVIRDDNGKVIGTVVVYKDGLIEIRAFNGTENKTIAVESIGTPGLQIVIDQIQIKGF